MLVSSSALLVALFFGGAAAKAVNPGALQPDHLAKTAQAGKGGDTSGPPSCASTCLIPLVPGPGVDMCAMVTGMMDGCAKTCPAKMKEEKLKDFCPRGSGGGGGDDAPPPCASTCQIPEPGPGVDMCAVVKGMMDGCAKTCPAKMKEEKLKDFCPPGSGGGGGDDAPPPCASTCQIPEPGPGVDMCAVVKGMMDGCAKTCPEKMKQAKLEDVCGPQSVDTGDSVG